MHPRERLPYSAIEGRRPLRLPDGLRLIVWPVLALEEWDLARPMARMVISPPQSQPMQPDIPNWTWHEYGMRVGFWRIKRVLDALKHECVQATFFLLGRNALAQSALARRILSEGHTVAHHTFSHPLLARMAPSVAEAEIERGFAAVDQAVYGRAEHAPATPFFRFPGFASSPALLEWLEQRGITVFGADLWVDDWNPISPQQELSLALGRIEANQGGIVLLHDTKARTAAMLPALLRALKMRGYQLVHVVSPAQGVK